MSAMSELPAIGADGRRFGIARLAALAVGQAAAAGVAAFATREVFVALRVDGGPWPMVAMALVAAAGVALALLSVGERVVAERVGQEYAGALRLTLFTHLSRMPARDVAGRRSGGLALRFVGDLAAVRNWVSLGIARLVSAGIVLPVATAVLFVLDARLGAAAAVPLVLGLLAMALAGPRLGPAHRRLRARRARLAVDMLERVPHAPELRLLGRIHLERERLARRTAALIRSAQSRASGAAALRGIADVVGGLSAAALMMTAFANGVAAPTVAAALSALALMLQPLRDLGGVWDRHRAWVVARDKCAAVLRSPTLRPRRRDARQPKSTAATASAAPPDVCADAAPKLRLNGMGGGALAGQGLLVRPGQKVAIVGPNGAGKSTLLRLAAGLEQQPQVRVMLNGVDPTALDARQRRRMLALVSARSPMLAGSLRRGLTMGSAPVPADDVIRARALAFGLGGLLQRLGGLDGQIAEGGRNLSSGEARRVLLTRAALSGAKLLLLDEPDDALDADGSDTVARFLHGAEATALVVTHSAALARQFDLIWYVEDGLVVETGPPAALLQGDGLVARHFRPRSVA